MTVSDHGLQALASLLESESSSAVSLMLEQMRGFPETQLLRLGTLAPADSPAQPYIDLILAERRAPRLQARFLAWLRAGADLEEGMLLVAEAGYPRLDPRAVTAKLDSLAESIRPHLPAKPEDRRLAALAAYLHGPLAFRGNTTDYYDPDNSYLNRVLERRTGLPLALTILCILLGRRLELPIDAIPLPGHVVGALPLGATPHYFDPFNGGTPLTLREVVGIVSRAGYTFTPELLRPATSRQIVERLLANLVHGYQEREDPERAELMRRLHATLAA